MIVTSKKINEKGFLYQVCTYENRDANIIVWKNENGYIDRLNKPAVMVYSKQGRLKAWLYYKEGKLHSYNKHKATIYFRSKNYNHWNFKIWLKEHKLHREGNLPAISVISKVQNKELITTMVAFFVNNKPNVNAKSSIIFNNKRFQDFFVEEMIILDEYDSYNGYSGYNHFSYDFNNKLIRKKRVEFQIENKINTLLESLLFKDNHFQDINSLLFKLIHSFISIRKEQQDIKECCYFKLPQDILAYPNRKKLNWKYRNPLNNELISVIMAWDETEKTFFHYINGKPKDDLFSPYVIVKDKSDNILDFYFANKDLSTYYKINKINPFNLNCEDKELIELNFSF